MITRLLKHIQAHADFISELLGGRPQLIPIKLVCTKCTFEGTVDSFYDHKCLTKEIW